MLYESASPSTSVADKRMLRTPSSSIALLPIADNTGASLTASTVTVITCDATYSPSVTDTVNCSLPL